MAPKNRMPNKGSDSAYALVYSTDKPAAKRCPGCQRSVDECACGDKALPQKLNPAIRFERKGRGGKSVTVLTKLPAQESFLKEFCGFLKRSLGTGGTFYTQDGEGVVEIQGDCRDTVKELVDKYKPAVKGSK